MGRLYAFCAQSRPKFFAKVLLPSWKRLPAIGNFDSGHIVSVFYWKISASYAHVFPKSTEIDIDADESMLSQGVTAVVDPGSAGVGSLETFVENVICRSTMEVEAYINLCPAGLATMKFHEDFRPSHWDKKRLAYFLEKYPRKLLGLKIRISRSIFGELGFDVVEKAVKLADELGTRLCVHTTDPVGSMAKVASILFGALLPRHGKHHHRRRWTCAARGNSGTGTRRGDGRGQRRQPLEFRGGLGRYSRWFLP